MLTWRIGLILDLCEAAIESAREKPRAKGNMLGWCGVDGRELEPKTGLMNEGGFIGAFDKS